MTKYRFKNREEFIRDGLWDEEDNCPYYWNSDGQMNKYLGMDVPDELNVHCNENEEFKYDGWLFQNTDYVLKEQQKYFDDLSQHIGRYIKALIDNPHSGWEVKKGDIGKIINKGQVDFPNRKGYSCTCALDKDHLGTKYELLPEDYSPEQKPSLEFIPGKWYNFTTMKGKYSLYVKVASVTGGNLFFMNRESISDGYLGEADGIDIKLIENPRLVEDLSEIQDFLPDGHPDKITSDVFKKGEYIVLISDGQSTGGTTLVQSNQFIKNHCYKVRENNKYLRPELDFCGSTTNGWECILYNPNKFHKTRNWRYATQEEIDEYERRGKPYDVTELQKKELSMEEIQEECKKRFPIGCTFTNTKGKTNVLRNDSYTYHINKQTILAHSGGGLLYADGKYATLVSLLEENITEIPEYVECIKLYGKAIPGKVYKTTDENESNNLFGFSWKKVLIDFGRLEDGSFKISNKEAYDQQKILTYESVSGCFPTDKNIFNYDEVGQYLSTAFDYWKNVPKFVEKEFDIYGPTPDIN